MQVQFAEKLPDVQREWKLVTASCSDYMFYD